MFPSQPRAAGEREMTDIDRPQGKLELRRVISDTFAVVGRRPVLMFVPSLLLALPGAILNYLNLTAVADGRPALAANIGIFAGFGFLVIGLLGIFWGTCLTYTAAKEVDGRSPDVPEILRESLRKTLPAWGLLILWSLGVGLASVLLIVPGVILALMWSASLPALVVERIGVLGAFSRSRDLTRGHRWRLFGLYFVFFLAFMIVEGLFLGLGAISLQSFGAVRVVVLSLFSGALTPLIYSLLAASYVQLRNLKDGGGSEAAAVFE